jgi:hypothetical protein
VLQCFDVEIYIVASDTSGTLLFYFIFNLKVFERLLKVITGNELSYFLENLSYFSLPSHVPYSHSCGFSQDKFALRDALGENALKNALSVCAT